jgi:geranylgeranyl pyrophosphate synthase
MEIHLEIRRYLQNLRPVSEWPEMNAVLNRRTASLPTHWHLPVTICLATGGTEQQAVPAAAAVAALQTAILLIDDLLDGDERTADLHLSQGDLSNLASAFQALSMEAILQSDLDPSIQYRLLACLNTSAHETALGQYWDAMNPQDESSYWRVAQTKSSPFFRAAFYSGARTCGVNEEAARSVGQLGSLYGEMIQIHDDLNDAIETPANSDWRLMRSPLPVLFAQLVKHPLRDRFLELRRAIDQPGALEEAQSILIRCGAVSYCFDQIIKRHQAAQKMLAEIRIANSQIIEEEFQKLVNPVWSLFKKVSND